MKLRIMTKGGNGKDYWLDVETKAPITEKFIVAFESMLNGSEETKILIHAEDKKPAVSKCCGQ